MKTIRTSRGTSDPARQRPARGHRGALSRRDGAARSRSLVRRHDEGDPRPGRPDDRRGTGRVPGREPLPQHGHLRERAARRPDPQAAQRTRRTARRPRSARVAELPGDALPLLLAVGDGGDAVRRPRRLRLRRSLRQARARRRARHAGRRDLDRRDGVDAPPRSQRRRIDLLRRLSAEAAAGGRRAGTGPAAGRRARRRHAAPQPPLRRDHGGLQHLVPRRVLRARDRHHQDAPGRHARSGTVRARPRRARPDAGPPRLLQLRRSLPAQEGGRDVRAGQVAAIRTSTSTRAPTAAPSPRSASGSSCGRASTR